MKELESIKFAHPLKKSGFQMREVTVYIYSAERVLSFKNVREGIQPEPDAFCVCHIPSLDFVDKRGYLMSLLKRVYRECLGMAEGYTFDFRLG